ncbi:MAG TPA: GNAT family N-acetyltransferase [Pseudoxanthomonas sp.]
MIETDRLGLYGLSADSAEDAAFMLKLLNEPSFIRNIGDRGVRSLEGARAYLRKGPVASYRKHGFGLYRVQAKASGETIGLCGLVKRDALDDVDLGYALLPEFCGYGYAAEAAAAVLAYAHSALGLERVVAITDPANQASIRLLEKLGFRFESMVRLSEDDIDLKLFASAIPLGSQR